LIRKNSKKAKGWLGYEESFKQTTDLMSRKQQALSGVGNEYRKRALQQLSQANKVKQKNLEKK